jgi:ElaB/YqjD/DUF883 family membrane-anchored ribosome-binding protein
MQNPGMPGSTSTDAKTDAMREQTQAGIDRAASTAHDTVDKVAGAASSAKDRLASAAAATKERLSEKGSEWYQQSQHAIECTRDCVRTHPLASIGIAVVAGMLISRITSSSHRAS